MRRMPSAGEGLKAGALSGFITRVPARQGFFPQSTDGKQGWEVAGPALLRQDAVGKG